MRRDHRIVELANDELAIIHKSGDHLLAVINEVLEIAKIEAGHVQLDLTPVDLVATISDIVGVFQLRAREKHIALTFETEVLRGRFVKTDEAKVRQILINLISNAIKATSSGGVWVRLRFEKGNNDTIAIEVQDSGIGIAEADFGRIFGPFEQLSTTSGMQGTGLGLTICREFATLLGGHIRLQSESGKGSVFTVTLPNDSTVTPPELVRHRAVGEVKKLAEGQNTVRVLVVDDDHENRHVLTRLLQGVGFEVIEVMDGQEAVERFISWAPQFIWMDIRMPVMNGSEAASRIRALPGGQQVKIAALTASIHQSDANAPGLFDATLHKPFSVHGVFDCMQQLLHVQYERDALVTESHPDDNAVLGLVKNLPVELKSELLNAIQKLSQDEVFSAIEHVRGCDASLADALMRMAKLYEYERISLMLVCTLASAESQQP